MQNISFKDWLNAQESSPFTRSRFMAIMGLGPDIPDASLNSHSTAPPWMFEKIKKKKKKKDKKKKIDEIVKSPTYSFDDFIKKAEELHKLFDELGKKKSEDEKKSKEEDKKKPKEDKKKPDRQSKKDIENKFTDNEIIKQKPSEGKRASFAVQKKKETSTKSKEIEDEKN